MVASSAWATKADSVIGISNTSAAARALRASGPRSGGVSITTAR